MSALEVASLRLAAEALRQRVFWRSKPQTELANLMCQYWDWVSENSLRLIEMSSIQNNPIIKGGE